MPRRRVKSSSACASARLHIQPVGFDGELTKIARVFASHALVTRSTSSRQPPSAVGVSGTARASPPSASTDALMFGQTGLTMTMLSPGSTRIWQASMIALIPALVTTTRSAPTGFSCSRVRYSAIVRRNAGMPRLWV